MQLPKWISMYLLIVDVLLHPAHLNRPPLWFCCMLNPWKPIKSASKHYIWKLVKPYSANKDYTFGSPDLWAMWIIVYSENSTEEPQASPHWKETYLGLWFDTFVTTAQQERAMARIHLSSRNGIFRIRNSCNSCHNKFMAKGILRNHKLRHTGEKQFSWYDLASLVLKTSCKDEPQEPQAPSHRREAYFRTLTCDICDNRSFRKRDLKHHVLGHTGKKPSLLKSLKGLWPLNFITLNSQ